MSDPTNPTTPPRPRKNWGWIGYFLFLLIASVAVTGFMIVFNYRLQLQPEKLQDAHALWKEKGPKDYDLIMHKTLGVGAVENIFTVKVRKGVVEDVKMNGKPLEKNAEQVDDPRIYFSMDAIFHDLVRFMDIDQRKDAKKVYKVADFDEKTGAVLRYTRYVMRTDERVNMTIKFTPAEK